MIIWRSSDQSCSAWQVKLTRAMNLESVSNAQTHASHYSGHFPGGRVFSTFSLNFCFSSCYPFANLFVSSQPRFRMLFLTSSGFSFTVSWSKLVVATLVVHVSAVDCMEINSLVVREVLLRSLLLCFTKFNWSVHILHMHVIFALFSYQNCHLLWVCDFLICLVTHVKSVISSVVQLSVLTCYTSIGVLRSLD